MTRVGLVAMLVLLAGCAPVKVYQRGFLAKPIMTFHPDPHEDALDQHFLESREGSAGGYGSAGGGCGCN